MTVEERLEELLFTLSQQGVQLWEESGQLRIRAPKGVLTPPLREELTRRKSEILSVLATRPSTPTAGPAESILLTRRPDSEQIPLSFGQQRLWLVDQFEPERRLAYNIPMAVHLLGPLDVPALQLSLEDVIQRHEVLRTTFGQADEAPMAILRPSRPFDLPLEALEHVPAAERMAYALHLAQEEIYRPFDLTTSPLFRAKLWRLSTEDHVLLMEAPHIAFDGRSIELLAGELQTLYNARLQGKPSPLPDLPIQYADYAFWQRRRHQDEFLEEQLGYWRRQLRGAPTVLDLPLDHTRSPIPNLNGATHAFALPDPLIEQARALARREGVTPFQVFLAVFQIVLSRYSGQLDFLIGSPTAGRNQVELGGLIGFFVNTLVLRADLTGDPTLKELLQRVNRTTLEAYAHDELPFERLVDEIEPHRDRSRPPLVQVNFTDQKVPPGMDLLGMVGRSLDIHEVGSKVDLALAIRSSTWGYQGRIEYDADLFDLETIERMAGHFQHVLESVVNYPDHAVTRVPLVTDAERTQLLEWGRSQASFPLDERIHTRFEEQAARRPNAVALVCDGQNQTYRELNARANQLAHHLRGLGVGPDDLVGICMERSLDMIAGLLGILKAGGAYLPLDPAYPVERLAFMLEDSQVSVLVTQERLLDELPEHMGEIVCVDTDWPVIAGESPENPSEVAHADNLAYVIYTSGSTGQPKGVLIEHRNVTRLLRATQDWFEFDERDVWTLFHSFAFDFSVWEIWGALLTGGRLVVVPRLVSRSPEEFYRLLVAEQVTVLNQTPSAFRQLTVAEELWEGDRLSLRLVIFGGEALEPANLSGWFSRHGDKCPQLINMFGITETTVHVTYRPMTAADVEGADSSPIGRAIPDLELYVLDQSRQLVPIGVTGELYVGGAGVARGYLNRPDLTAGRFIPHPFRPGDRLYASGDLGRVLPDGSIDYLGRRDHQVKIRGFRIELGEIEMVLLQHPVVKEVAVLADTDEQEQKRLVAYVIPDKGAAPSDRELRAHLKTQLPEYMIPAAFVLLDVFPLTDNGKLDRTALPAPDGERAAEEGYIPPSTVLESALVEIWENVLEMRPIGVNDDFFDLGGHSFLAIRLLDRVEQILGLHVTPAVFAAAPTIKDLAHTLEHLDEVELDAAVVPMRREGARAPFFFCRGHREGPSLYAFSLGKEMGADQPYYVLQPGRLDLDGRAPTIAGMANALLKEVRSVQPTGPYFLGGHCEGGTVSFEMARQLEAAGETVGLVTLVNTRMWTPQPRILFTAIHTLCHFLGISPEQEVEAVLRTRLLVHRTRALAAGHLGELRRNTRANLPSYARTLAGEARRSMKRRFRGGATAAKKPLPKKVARVLGVSLDDLRRIEAASELRARSPREWYEKRQAIMMDLHARASASYIPQRINARIRGIAPDELPPPTDYEVGTEDDVTALSPDAQVRVFSGRRASYVITRRLEIATLIRDWLREAQEVGLEASR